LTRLGGTWQGTARLVEHDLNLAGGAAAGTPSYTDLSTSIFSSATPGAQMVRAHVSARSKPLPRTMHSRSQGSSHAHWHARAHELAHARMHAHTHKPASPHNTQLHTRTATCTYTHLRIRTHRHARTGTRTHARTHAHTHMHTNAHTRTHMHTHTVSRKLWQATTRFEHTTTAHTDSWTKIFFLTAVGAQTVTALPDPPIIPHVPKRVANKQGGLGG
jgi:hypothetical protein